MWFARWIPTFLGFPLGGLLAIQVVGTIDGPLSASLAGLLAGAIIGTAQWLALRSSGVSYLWAIYTALAMSAGSAAAAASTDAGTTDGALVLKGLVVGAAVGAAQGFALARGPQVAAGWTAVVSLSWALGWLVTAKVIVDAERGYASFGASGALVATALTGAALYLVLGRERGEARSSKPEPNAWPGTAENR